MAQIKSKWTSCEKKLHNYLKGNHVKHAMHPQMNGNPDILISKKKLLIFVHGCFWHSALNVTENHHQIRNIGPTKSKAISRGTKK